MNAVITAGKKGSVDAELVRETFNALCSHLPTEKSGKDFDYASYFEERISGF